MHFGAVLFVFTLVVNCLIVMGQRNSSRLHKRATLQWTSPLVENPQSLAVKYEVDFETNFFKLPSSGTVNLIPWATNYLPLAVGGLDLKPPKNKSPRITDRNGYTKLVNYPILSFAELYEKAFNTSSLLPTIKNEINELTMEYTTPCTSAVDCQANNEVCYMDGLTTRGKCLPAWLGYCDGSSKAAMIHKQPRISVNIGGVKFTPATFRALLTYIYSSSQTYMSGRACVIDEQSAKNIRRRRMIGDACMGINPGTMHSILGNVVGRSKQSVGMNMYTDSMIWNYPIYKYEFNHTKTITVDRAYSGTTRMKFSPGTYRLAEVVTNLYFMKSNKRAFGKYESDEEMIKKYGGMFKVASYVELNRRNDILGGEWIRNSVHKHPGYFFSTKGLEFSSQLKQEMLLNLLPYLEQSSY